MLFRASKELGIDLSRSIMIGDKHSDLLAAKRAGIPSRILISSYFTTNGSKYFSVIFHRLRSITSEVRKVNLPSEANMEISDPTQS